jgi:hypothetical protein
VEELEPRFLLAVSPAHQVVGDPSLDLGPALGTAPTAPTYLLSTGPGGNALAELSGAVPPPPAQANAPPPDGLTLLYDSPGAPPPPANGSGLVAGPDDGSAVIVMPPALFKAAERLPNAARVELKGSIDPAHQEKLYRIPIDDAGGPIALEFDLRADPADVPVPERMVLFDESGRKLDDALPSPGELTVELRYTASPLERAQPLFLLITTPPDALAATSGSQPESFVLDVTRQVLPEVSVPLGPGMGLVSQLQGPDGSSAVASEPTGPSLVLLDEPLSIASPWLAPVPTPISSPPGLIPVATGPLPARAAAALGGVLASGDQAPLIDRQEAVADNLQWVGAARPVPAGWAAAGAGKCLAEGAILVGDQLDAGSIAWRGPGGFPLLASSLEVGRRFTSAVPGGRPPISDPAEAESPAVLAKAAPDVTVSGASRRRPRAARRITAMTGMTVALSLAFGLALPDLAATFSLASPPRSRLRLRRLLRGLRSGSN